MKFETLSLERAEGAILAHSVRLPNFVIPKGRRLDAAQVEQLGAVGITAVTVACIEAGDVPEDCAATRAARNLVGRGALAKAAEKGRVNICAVNRGVFWLDPQCIHALNLIDESITVATLPLYEIVEERQVVATIKVNPFAVPENVVSAWENTAVACSVSPFQPYRASLIQTVSDSLKQSTLDKTERNTQERVEALGSSLVATVRTAHSSEELALAITTRLNAGDELILICGASSITDRRDVIPAAIERVGGTVEHFGMPVDPGNLLLLGAAGNVPIVGMPGCARTLQLNGFDYVLRLILARLSVGSKQIMAMGVGGLLSAPSGRHAGYVESPRALSKASEQCAVASPRIAAVVLAAGQSSRMGANKLLLSLDGKPVIAHVVDKLRKSNVVSIVLVLGSDADKLRTLFEADDICFAFNERYREGLSTSLKCGIASLAADIDGAMIFLGDMPDFDPDLPNRMIAEFERSKSPSIIVPIRSGRRGHPVLWGREFFSRLLDGPSGDTGARQLLEECSASVSEVDGYDDGVIADLDTPEEFAARNRHGAARGVDEIAAEAALGSRSDVRRKPWEDVSVNGIK